MRKHIGQFLKDTKTADRVANLTHDKNDNLLHTTTHGSNHSMLVAAINKLIESQPEEVKSEKNGEVKSLNQEN